MKEEEKRGERESLAFGQFLAAVPELRELKKRAAASLAQGGADEEIRSELREATLQMGNDLERAAGHTDWLAGWLVDWAKTGEPGPTYAGFPGRVWVQTWEVDGEPVSAVLAISSPFGSARDLADQFVQLCDRTFPHASRARFKDPAKAARCWRMHEEGMSWGEIAKEYVRDDRPDLEEDDPRFRELMRLERDSIKKTAKRWWDGYGEEIVRYLSLGIR